MEEPTNYVMGRAPIHVTAWMLGHYQAQVDNNKLLSDVPLWQLDPRYLHELEKRAWKETAYLQTDTAMFKELKEAYIKIDELERRLY